ncbi:MAG: hypothetical protein J0H17_17535 [Rhizobiales bacterium]|nr:hypothetical protein [Hyphomicrobiales bacterium]
MLVKNGIRLTDAQRLDWLRLIRSENVGPRGIMAQTPQAGPRMIRLRASLTSERAHLFCPPPVVASFVLRSGEDLGMAEKKEKTVSYRRAVWVDDVSGIDLEWCIREAHLKLKTVEERTIGYGGTLTRSARQRNVGSDDKSGLVLHLVADTPGESASVVPKVPERSSGLDLKTEAPPPDGEWLDGDAFVFVKGDHVCFCATGMRDGSIHWFLRELFKKAHLRKDSERFELAKAADITKLRLLHSQGVKEIEIKALVSQATALYEKRKATTYGTLGAAGKFLKSIWKAPNDYTNDSLNMVLSLKVDKRRRNGIKLGEKRIEALAVDIVKNAEKGDDFSILTKTGQRITQSEIFIRSKVLIDGEGKTVKRDKAWNELVEFYKVLTRSGSVE